MKAKVRPLSRQSNIAMQEIGNEILLYDLDSNKAFSLNETSALVWQECDGKKDVSQISQILSDKLNTAVSEDLVWLAIDELKKENLFENGTQLNSVFGGMSRREVVKRVALGSMIALPVIVSLIAPTAVMAQTGCVQTSFFDEGGNYVNNGNCEVTPGGPTPCCETPANPNIVCCGQCIDIIAVGGDCGVTN